MSSGFLPKKSKRVGAPSGDVTPKTVLAKKLQAVCGIENFTKAAQLFGVTNVSAKRYLVGSQSPVSGSLANLHASTGVDLNWLLDDTDEREGPIFIRKRKA